MFIIRSIRCPDQTRKNGRRSLTGMKEYSPTGTMETTGKQKLPAVFLHEIDEQREGCVRKGGEGLTPERVLLSPERMEYRLEGLERRLGFGLESSRQNRRKMKSVAIKSLPPMQSFQNTRFCT